MSIHVFNILLWSLFYLILPEPTPCDAAIMEQHYKKHKKEMEELCNYVHATLDDSCSIVLNYRNEKIEEFRLDNKRKGFYCSKLNNEQEFAFELSRIGITVQELSIIREKMNQAGIIGIEIDKKCNQYSDDKDILAYYTLLLLALEELYYLYEFKSADYVLSHIDEDISKLQKSMLDNVNQLDKSFNEKYRDTLTKEGILPENIGKIKTLNKEVLKFLKKE